jgi:hypothetical protein
VGPEEGVEPTRPCDQRILSPPRLPFRHSGPRLGKVTRRRAPLKPQLLIAVRNFIAVLYDAGSACLLVGMLIAMPSVSATPIVTSVAIKFGFAAIR